MGKKTGHNPGLLLICSPPGVDSQVAVRWGSGC